jgi:dTMP kinase
MKRGKLIVIDGTDGTGKATQTGMLIDRLKNEGRNVLMQDFPRYGQRSANLVEDYLNGEFGTAKEVGPYRASIFYACDRFAASREIQRSLQSGAIVVSNRYVSANMGHQSGKIHDLRERDKFLDWLDKLEFEIFQIPRPDLQLLIYADPKIAQRRVDKKGHRNYVGGVKRDIHEADINHLRNASEAFLYCAEKFGWGIINDDGRKPEEIHEDIYKIVKPLLEGF